MPKLIQIWNKWPRTEKKVMQIFGDVSHALWDACISKGREVYIGSICVVATQESYRLFHNNTGNYGYYITHEIKQENFAVVYEKIPRYYKQMVVHSICVTDRHAEN